MNKVVEKVKRRKDLGEGKSERSFGEHTKNRTHEEQGHGSSHKYVKIGASRGTETPKIITE